MKGFKAHIYLILVTLLFAAPSYAWNALGHMVVAEIAYQQLTPEVRNQVNKMTQDLKKEYNSLTDFTSLGPWADNLRSQSIETFSRWHYIDIPFSVDDTPVKDLISTDNIVWALNKVSPVVKNSKANIYERARFLAFLVHFVGDSHQPLHASSRISQAHPDGDLGGNLYPVLSPSASVKTTNLHSLWDSGVNLFSGSQSEDNAKSIATSLMSLYPEIYFGAAAQDLSAEDWADESFKIATQFVYTTPENQVPNAAYVQAAQKIAAQQAALAGYRLAHVLNTLTW